MTKPWLFIDGGAFIYGNTEGLKALRNTINAALKGDVDPDDFARASSMHLGESHVTTYCVRCVDDLAELESIIEQA